MKSKTFMPQLWETNLLPRRALGRYKQSLEKAMKLARLRCTAAMTLPVLLAIPIPLAAQEAQDQKQLHYSVKDLGTLGGTFSVGDGINNKGWVTGSASLTGNTAQHVFLRRREQKMDLGTLGGPNSAQFGSGGPSDKGQVVGDAETSTPDPLGEDFCFFGTHLICLPFLWQKGAMTPLPTLGGNNGAAYAINDRGQVAGVAENAMLDSTCPSSEYQSQPVIWEKGAIQELPTVAGDPDGLVVRINDRGQAVGGSGDCFQSNTFSLHAVLWQNGTGTDLGTLGGTLYSIGIGINDKGQVVGGSDLPGDTNFWAFPIINAHAFLWQNNVIADLGTLPGDATSFANAINNKGQAVGNGSRAILWHSGGLIDLNTLVPGPPFSPLYLLAANDINDRGEIVGIGLAIDGDLHAFLAIPCDDDHAAIEGCKDDAGLSAAEEPAQPTPVTEGASALTRGHPTLGGQRRQMLNQPGIRQFPGRYFPRPGTGPMR